MSEVEGQGEVEVGVEVGIGVEVGQVQKDESKLLFLLDLRSI